MPRLTCNLVHRDTGAHCAKPVHAEPQHHGFSHYPGQVVAWTEQVRQDKRGRRIGRNWWREFNWGVWWEATQHWERQREEACIGYATEEAEFHALNPPPRFKDVLIANAGLSRFSVQ